MRTDLYRDPKVCIVADYLMQPDSDLAQHINQNTQRAMTVTRNVMRNVTVGALVTVWGVMRLRGKRAGDDLVVRHASLSVIDDLAELAGFGEALASVDWVEETDEGIVFPNFFEHYNVDPNEDKQSAAAERQRRYRERKKTEGDVTRDATVTSQSNAREEKRREEKEVKDKNTMPSAGADDVCDFPVIPTSKVPDCPHQQIIDLYHQHCPTMRQVKVWNTERKKFLQARWRENPKHQNLEFWQKFFDYANTSEFLRGDTGKFAADLEWLVRPTNFAKVVEGKYENQAENYRPLVKQQFIDKHTDRDWAEGLN